MARHRPRGRLSKPRKALRWGAATQTFLALSAGTQALAFISAGTERSTLMRIRGNLIASMDGNQAPGGLIDVAVGIAVVPEGSGTTVLWSPAADSNAPWLFYDRFVVGYEEPVTDVIDIPAISGYRAKVDNKAMRILRPDVEVQIVVENTTLSGGAAINLVFSSRILFQDL